MSCVIYIEASLDHSLDHLVYKEFDANTAGNFDNLNMKQSIFRRFSSVVSSVNITPHLHCVCLHWSQACSHGAAYVKTKLIWVGHFTFQSRPHLMLTVTTLTETKEAQRQK